MELRRRHFIGTGLTLLASLGISHKTIAFPLPQLLGNPEGVFVKKYLERYLDWYQLHWKVQIPHQYTHLISGWIKEIELFGTNRESAFFENFLTRHSLDSEKQGHGRFYFGLPHWPDHLLSDVRNLNSKFFSEIEINQMPWEHFFGFSFDLHNHSTKLFFWNKNQTKINQQLGVPSNANSLYFIEKINTKKIHTGLIRYIDKIPLAGHTGLIDRSIINGFEILRSDGSKAYKIRTRSTLYESLPKGTAKIAVAHKREFHQQTDFLDTSNPGTLKIYYP